MSRENKAVVLLAVLGIAFCFMGIVKLAKGNFNGAENCAQWAFMLVIVAALSEVKNKTRK